MPTSAEMQFFAKPENLEAIRTVARTLKGLDAARTENPIVKPLLKIVNLMAANADYFDEHCTVNIEWIGETFMHGIREFPKLSGDDQIAAATSVFPDAFRFLCELEFSQPGEASQDIRSVGRFVDESIDLFNVDERRQLHFARYSMPVQIAKKLLNDPRIVDFRKFSQTVDSASKLKTEWDSELDQRRKHVDSIKLALKEATSAYNFVGLVNGFRHLASAKMEERKVAFWSLIALAIVMVMPPFGQVAYVLTHLDTIEAKKGLLLYTLPAILTIEVIAIYFFRVVLAQFRSVKAQVLQLDLRIALCQFVQSYAEYASTIKKDDPHTLSKFEAVVFSSLVPESENIPSTFDGTDQIASLIKSIRGT